MMKIIKILLIIFIPIILYSQTDREYEVKKIEFYNNKAFDEVQLKSIISSKETPGFFSKLFNKISNYGRPPSFLDTIKVLLDIKSITNFYKDNGYFDVNVKKNIIYDEKNNEAIVEFYINEGKPYRVSKINIYGIDSLDKELKKQVYKFIRDTNKIFIRDEIIELRNNILTILLNNGYMFAKNDQIKANMDTTKKNIEIELYYTLYKKYYISDIYVQKSGIGKDEVEDDLIVYIVNYPKGSIYSSDNLKKSQIRLVKTNLFSSVLVTSVISDTIGNTVPLRATVDIGTMNEIVPDFFINDEDNRLNIGIGNSYTRKNFLGGARKLNIQNIIKFQDIYRFNFKRFSKSFIDKDTSLYATYQAVLSVDQPYFLGYPIYNKIDFSLSLKKDKTFNNFILGGKLYFNFDLPPKVFLTGLNTYLSYEYVKSIYREYYLIETYKKYYNDTSSESIQKLTNLFSDPKNRTKINLNEILGFELSSYKTDNLFFPKKGHNLSLLFEEVNFFPYLYRTIAKTQMSNPAFFKILFSGSYYTKVLHSDDNILATKLKVGKIFTYYGGITDLPNNRTFFIGGSNSVRAWLVRELYTKQIVSDNSIDKTYFDDPSKTGFILNKLLERNLTKTGSVLIESSIELRNIIIGDFGATLFIDAGNIWNNYKKITLSDFGVATGLGLRYYSSFAPIRLDFAFKLWDPLTQESLIGKKIFSKFAFQFGIGEAF